MPHFKNNAPGPRVLNVAGGAPGVILQVVLQPGETSADLTLADGPEKDFALKGWLESGQLEEVSAKPATRLAAAADAFDPEELAKAQEELVAAQAKVERLSSLRQSLELDQARLTPPRQFGGDGGPQQVPTVDGQGGALTPSQEEKGRAELPPSEVAKAVAERHAATAKAAADEKAKAAADEKAKAEAAAKAKR